MFQISKRLACALVLALVGGAGMAQTIETNGANKVAFDPEACEAADDSLLDSLRGGFQINPSLPGLAISFGFTRSVTINGDLASQVHFTLPDLSHISLDQAKQVGEALAQVRVVQTGAGNSVVAGNGNALSIGGSALGEAGLAANSNGALASIPVGVLANSTVVQNTLSNQHIQTLTQIDTGVNSLGILHSINSQGVLRDAIMGAIGVH